MYPLIFVSSNQEALEDHINQAEYSEFVRYDIRPLKSALTIDQTRNLKKQLTIKPGSKRLIVIYGLDEAAVEVQNALLKTLEETTHDNQFVLSVQRLNSILPTIQSRCQIIRADDGQIEVMLSETQLEEIFLSLQDTNHVSLQLPSLQVATIEDAVTLLKSFIHFLNSKIAKGDVYSAKLAKKALEMLDLVSNNNLNPQLALDHLIIYAKRTALQIK